MIFKTITTIVIIVPLFIVTKTIELIHTCLSTILNQVIMEMEDDKN